jgi:phospholipase C
MLENHSFDSLLGWSGISGTDVVTHRKRRIPQPAGTEVYAGVIYALATPALNPMLIDPGHEFADTVEQAPRGPIGSSCTRRRQAG